MAPKAKNGIRDFKTHIPFTLTVQLNFTPSTGELRNLFWAYMGPIWSDCREQKLRTQDR